MPEPIQKLRRRRIARWQQGTQTPGFAPGTAPMILWPQQRQRADRTLAVENLRRAYMRWKASR